jgi:hypothetical protein
MLFLMLAVAAAGLWLAGNLSPVETAVAQSDDDVLMYFPIMARNFSQSPAEIRGVVFDALVGKDNGFLAQSTVCIRGTTTCAIANNAGEYLFTNMLSGNYILQAFKPGFTPLERFVIIKAGDNVVDLPLSPLIQPGQFRIVLTWNEDVDLDAHLWLPIQTPYHVNNLTGNLSGVGDCDSFPFACIDVDSVNGSKPETITISNARPGTYTYAVLHYDYASGIFNKPSFKVTGATVDVYGSSGLLASFNVPQVGEEFSRWWSVFTLTDTGVVTPVNVLNSEYPPGSYPSD